jgi:hypothetical protein
VGWRVWRRESPWLRRPAANCLRVGQMGLKTSKMMKQSHYVHEKKGVTKNNIHNNGNQYIPFGINMLGHKKKSKHQK